MTSRRPPSQRNASSVQQRMARQLQSMVPGAENGRLASAGPVKQFSGPPDALFGFDGGVASSASRASKVDLFTLTSNGAQDLTLTYVPVEDSWNLLHNRLGMVEGEHFTISSHTVSLEGTNVLSGDTIRVQYDYLAEFADPIVTGSDYDLEVLADAPIGYWKLDDTGTTVADSSGHGHTGTTIGAVVRRTASLLPSGVDYSTEFPDDPKYVTVPTSSAFNTSAFHLMFWIDHGNSGSITLYDHPGRVSIAIGGGVGEFRINGVLKASTDGSWCDSSTSKCLGVSYDGANVKFWKNGSQYGTSTACTTALPSVSTDLTFGDITGNDPLGRMDQVALYGTALGAARIAAQYGAA